MGEEKKEERPVTHEINMSFSDEWWKMAEKALELLNRLRLQQQLSKLTLEEYAKQVVLQSMSQLMIQVESL